MHQTWTSTACWKTARDREEERWRVSKHLSIKDCTNAQDFASFSSRRRDDVSKTTKSVSSDIQTLKSGSKKTRLRLVFFNQHRSVWISDETLFLKALIILGEIQSRKKSSPNFMIIRITYPNLLHSSDFLCFAMNYL